MHYIRKGKLLVPEYTSGSGHGIELASQHMRGEVRCVLRDIMGNELLDTGWFPNLITDGGLYHMGNLSGWGQKLVIGSSGTAPVVTNTTVGSFLAATNLTQELNNIPVAPNYEIWMTSKSRFNAGVGTGTVREIAAQPTTVADNTNICTHALLPAPIVKASDQILDVYYRMYRYPDLVDRTGTVMIEGVSYDYIVRGAYLASSAQPGSSGTANAWGQLGLDYSTTGNQASDLEITDVTTGPLSNLPTPWQSSGAKNSTGTGTANFTIAWGIDNANGNIRSFKLREEGHGNSLARGWQIRIGKTSDDTRLLKEDTKELRLTFDVTWGRYP